MSKRRWGLECACTTPPALSVKKGAPLSYRVVQGNDGPRRVQPGGQGRVAGVRHDVEGPREAGSVGHAHDLPLDGCAQNSAQHLHGHP